MRSSKSLVGDALTNSAPIPPAENSSLSSKSANPPIQIDEARKLLLQNGARQLAYHDPRCETVFESLKNDLIGLAVHVEQLYLAMEKGDYNDMEGHASRVKLSGNEVRFHASQISEFAQSSAMRKGARRG